MQNWQIDPTSATKNSNGSTIRSHSSKEANADTFRNISSHEYPTTIANSSPQDSNNQSISYLRGILSSTSEREIDADYVASPAESADQPQSSRQANNRDLSGNSKGDRSQARISQDIERVSSFNSNVTNHTPNNRRGPPSTAGRQSLSPHQNSQVSFNSPERQRTESGNHRHQQQQQQSKRRRIATQRLDKTIEATDKLVAVIEDKTEMKKRYYQAKLELMDANVTAKERMATELASIASLASQNFSS